MSSFLFHASYSFDMVVRRYAWVAVLISVLVSGCATTHSGQRRGNEEKVERLTRRVESLEQAVSTWKERAFLRHPTLDATLWVQTAVEYAGVTRGAYRLASTMMDAALRDSTWSAVLPQAERAPSQYRDKPPAVILDVDETVLDNSAYQARLIHQNTSYDTDSWNAWCREREAEAVPGARRFTRRADSLGVQVIYLTNRDSVVEAATRDNLRQLGFPVDESPGGVLTQGERPGWEAKGPRRAWVAERYRVLLLIGDNFGDFVSGADTTLQARRERAEAHASFWGTRWIALPNPQYGSWEGALIEFDYGRSRWEHLRRKHNRLDTRQED